jgi:hypothetical protein
MSLSKKSVVNEESRNGRDTAGWLKLNAHTLILIAVLAGGWIANFATLSARMSEVEKSEGKIEQRFDRDVVPRQEQEVRDRMLDQRLAQMQKSLDAIQQELQRPKRSF